MRIHRKRKGFTLIETIIYIGLFGLVISSFVAFALSISNSRNKTFVVSEVNANGRLALDVISQNIRLADDVVTPTEGNTSASLVLDMPNTGDNTTFAVSGGVLEMTVGANPAVALTTDQVNVSGLQFENVTNAGDKQNVRITMTIEFAGADDSGFGYDESWQTAVSLRK